MAAISISNLFQTKTSFTPQHHVKSNSRIFIIVCVSQNQGEEKKGKKGMIPLFVSVEKFGKGLKDSLSPKQKGDWKDLTLMSLSFAVYVYMSQKIVCAYCAWMSMLQHSW